MNANTRHNSVVVWLVGVAVLTVASARADEVDDQFAVAAGHYDRHQWKFAVEEFQNFLKKYPNDQRTAQSGFYLGEAFLQLGDYEQASEQLQQYLVREPEGKYARPALFRAGEAEFLSGKMNDAAKADLEQFRTKYPNDRLNAYVLYYLGEVALSRNDSTEAAALFREGLKRFPEGQLQDDCSIGLAQSLELQNRPAGTEEAEQLYASVAAKPASTVADAAQFHLGALQYATGRYDQAIETLSAFESRLAKSPWQPNAKLGLGWALMKRGQFDRATKMFEAVAADEKLGVEAGYWLGLAQKAQNNWTAAAEILVALAVANPSHELTPAIRFHAGDALLNAGDLPTAIQQFDAVIASADPELLQQAFRGKLQAQLQSKDYAAVDREAETFDKQFPNSEMKNDVRRLLARSLIERKDFARAAAVLQPTVTPAGREQKDLESRYLLGLAFEGLNQREDALTILLPVVESADNPLKADAQLVQGSLLLALKQYPQAVVSLEAFVASQPSGDAAVKGMGELAICYAHTQQMDKAKRLFAELTDKYAQHPLLAPTIEHLAEAAYDANDIAWSAELSSRLGKVGASPEYEVKGQLGLGWSQFKAGNLNEAAATFDQVLKSNPAEAVAVEAALARGQILDQLGQSAAALAMHDLVIDKYPKSNQHGDALLAAARLRAKLKQYERSASDYQRLVDEHPQAPDLDAAVYEWAWVLQDSNRVDAAANLFERLHREFPQSRFWADAVYRLAQRAFEAKNYDQADALVGEVLGGKSEPRIREYAAYLGGQVAVAKGDWPKAREWFDSFVKEFPDSPRCPAAEFWIAETLYRQIPQDDAADHQNDYAAAGERFDLLAKQVEDRHEPWMAMIPLRRAQIRVQLNQWEKASQIATKIADEFPSFEQQYEVDYVLGRCFAHQADFDAARKAYTAVIRSATGAKTETAAMAQWMIGETFFHQKDYEPALHAYLQLEILYAYPTWQAAALLQAGKCHELLGQAKKAAELYQRILKFYPTTQFVEQARQRLQNVSAQQSGDAHNKS